MRRTTFTVTIALLTVMAGPPALAQAPFGIGGGGFSIGGPSGFSVGPGGIAIGGPSGVVVGSGITIGGAAEFDAVFGALPAAALGDATGN